MSTAVHFGAGNIGRGFIGLVLHEAGYDVVFVDVNAELIRELQSVDSYEVREVGAHPRTHVVDRFRAVDSREDEAEAIAAVAAADIVTCAVGPNVLKFIAPVIREGLRARPDDAAPLVVMACENAIGATDTLAGFVLEGAGELASRAVFANTAVDRIIPAVDVQGVDVVVEDFFEWSIDRRPFHGHEPVIPAAHFVDDLGPYIERKLFTVNTGHATAAYHGYRAGEPSIAAALANPAVRAEVEAALGETSALLVEKYGFDAAEHAAYVARALERFENPDLPDTPVRIGRQPLRKLSRHERFIGPAAEAAERGLATDALTRAVGAALAFDAPEDPEAVELQGLLSSLDAAELTTKVTGLTPEHPLTERVEEVVRAAQAARPASDED
ncbi:mannitol-1-phosphate 5-dehydrogenase [Pseudoclavibacter chungangensis]|uniref:Mannitol-1-phosphate 5-dehydrogenase n=1 Tax=Pseudoclavibacter chungangensis TaxID=587635 RepID=A0A7J5C134_9MICO|nr:mannitol-1-phosphate 5-dehydrogenase [Pseudoclavibacter chungangensis]KAB1662325.1 mannitol-1-phosphate 5-dehydrogenase [Pseudoclavibacter chungangensis]NYJ65534.1 mannitol-1-phosphate 5-dehydrogenase [Pseudoclavibacter chungangensis]